MRAVHLFSKLKNEIVLWFLLLALIPMLVLTTLNYFYQKERFQAQTEKQLNLMLNQKIQDLELSLTYMGKEIRTLAATPVVRKSMQLFEKELKNDFTAIDINQINDYEAFFVNTTKENDFYDLFLINLAGDIVFSVKKEADYATNLKNGIYANSNLSQVFLSAISFLDVAFSDFDYYAPSNSSAAFSAVPVFGEGRLLGVLAVQIDKKRIDELFEGAYGLGETGEFVVARKGMVNSAIPVIPMKYLPGAYESRQAFPDNPKIPIQKAVSGDKNQGVLEDYRGEKVIAAWGYLPLLRWGVVAKIDLNEVLVPIYELRFYSAVVLFFVSIGIIVAVLSLVRRMVAPIELLNTRVSKFSKGDFNERVHIDVNNEVGLLAKNFNEMANALMQSQKTVKDYALELENKVSQRTRELELAKTKLEVANREAAVFMQLSDEYVLSSSTDLAGKIIRVSGAFCVASGYRQDELIGANHNVLRHPEMDSKVFRDLWSTLGNKSIWQGEFKNLRKDGSFFWVSVNIFPIFDDFNNVKEFTAIYQDISDKKKVEELSFKDHLTGLANRHRMEQVFHDEIARSQRYGRSFAVILLDLDYFKQINDQFGHNAGDCVLSEVSNLLAKNIRINDVAGRWGGEEFIIVTPETRLEEAKALAEKIRDAIQTHFFSEHFSVTGSFGVAQFQAKDTQDSLVKRADTALYESKEQGRNRVSVNFAKTKT